MLRVDWDLNYLQQRFACFFCSKYNLIVQKMESKHMLNTFSTTKSWMVASLLAATSVFAQDSNSAPASKCRPQKSYEQGHELTASQMMAAYNAPARIDVRGAWDFYATGSFIYW